MNSEQWLAEHFERDRARLRKVAYRLLGSSTEAEDAVQEAWLRLSRSDAGYIENLSGWLTTVVARVCLDMLRSRRSREETLEAFSGRVAGAGEKPDMEEEGLIADSVGLALLVVMNRLTPPERIAFVLHDVFDVPFDEIGLIVGRTPTAARQLASRARCRVRRQPAIPTHELCDRQQVVVAFLEAVRGGNMDAIVALLDPKIVLRADASAAPGRKPVEVRGATDVAKGALAFAWRTRFAIPMLVNGTPGIVVAPGGRPALTLIMDIPSQQIRAIEIIGDPSRLRQMNFGAMY
jgi:RNA polymerase sigma factor (sigma-70 family)